ncbi:MAG: hypothetical protein LBR05_07570 [Azoarcus sp.]|nr:hypothetical protein [Azoarcus sp.]
MGKPKSKEGSVVSGGSTMQGAAASGSLAMCSVSSPFGGVVGAGFAFFALLVLAGFLGVSVLGLGFCVRRRLGFGASSTTGAATAASVATGAGRLVGVPHRRQNLGRGEPNSVPQCSHNMS